jgi:thiazole synthase
MLKIIIAQSGVPVVIDAGIGAPSHACLAMEMGASAVLVNTAIAAASNPAVMAKCFRQAVESGRMAFEEGLSEQNDNAIASSPLTEWLND